MIEDEEYKFNPDDDERIIQISAGGKHTLVLTNNGNIYSWGYGVFG